MKQLLWAERKKLRHSKIIRIAAFAVALTAVISYMICREEQEDTMKSLRLVPIDEVKLTVAKMIIAMMFSVLIYLMLFMITFAVEAVMHFQALSVQMVFGFLYTYLVNGVGIFLAISPIIALVACMKRGYWLALIFAEIYSFAGLFASMSETLKTIYPITAVFQLSGYYETTIGNKVVSLVILIVCLALAAFIMITNAYNHVP